MTGHIYTCGLCGEQSKPMAKQPKGWSLWRLTKGWIHLCPRCEKQRDDFFNSTRTTTKPKPREP